MLNYSYVARDHRSQLIRGNQLAGSPQQLRTLLSGKNLQLVSWSQSPAKASSKSPIQLTKLKVSFWSKPRWQNIEVALRQLAMMLRSGLDLRSALHAVANQASSQRMKRSLERVVHDVERGQAFASALQSSGAYPPIVVQLVAVGEASGTLTDVLEKAASHLERRRVSISTVRTALAYPAVVAVAAVSIALYLVISVIPQLQKFLTAMGRKLPAMTQSLVDLSIGLQLYGLPLLVIIIALVVAFIAAMRWPTARQVIDRWLLRMPIVGHILQVAGTGTLASSLAVMTRSGVQLVESLSIAASLQNNRHLADCVQRAAVAVRRGEPLASSFTTQPGYVPMLASMLDIASRTGQLELALDDVAKWSDTELQNKVKRLSMLVEPAIIVIAGGIVGYVYMAFFMALMSAGVGVR